MCKHYNTIYTNTACSVAVLSVRMLSVFVCSCSVAVLSGLRPHEGSEERESYHLSDEVPDFT